MAVLQVKPTRMELARLKKRLASSTRGHRLLKDKRDDMIKRFIQLAEKNIELRTRLEEKMKNINTTRKKITKALTATNKVNTINRK